MNWKVLTLKGLQLGQQIIEAGKWLRLDITEDKKTFNNNCKHVVTNNFVLTWFTNMHDLQLNPILRT